MEGKVKFFNEQKGYGFIKDKDSDKEYFFHATGLLDRIAKDNLVEFELEEGKRGIKAVNILKKK